MKLEEITLSNIKSFIQGYARFYLDKISLLPTYRKEQVFYRIYTCRDTCIPFGKCEKCNCPAIEKAYATSSCNKSKFTDLLSKEKWEEYKIENFIDEELLLTIITEVQKIFKK